MNRYNAIRYNAIVRKAVVTSGKQYHVSQSDFFPLLKMMMSVTASEAVKKGNAKDFSSPSMVLCQ